MVARGDAVLIGLPGVMALYVGAFMSISSRFQAWFGIVLLGVGIGVLALAVALYVAAGPAPWTPRSAGGPPWVTLACPVYGTPLAWVDEVGKWYCTQCQAYHGPARA
jgi:hypothetical protein